MHKALLAISGYHMHAFFINKNQMWGHIFPSSVYILNQISHSLKQWRCLSTAQLDLKHREGTQVREQTGYQISTVLLLRALSIICEKLISISFHWNLRKTWGYFVSSPFAQCYNSCKTLKWVPYCGLDLESIIREKNQITRFCSSLNEH